ncbi:hypothetical protein [Paenibacillus faecalis]|uniref:hypothetical protein n=1 Tax=Paenibacillus faecalis TaxID=2079532 RepID=UPI00131A4AC6|nr:hypothetical protein [Paenibacillus faecalis]
MKRAGTLLVSLMLMASFASPPLKAVQQPETSKQFEPSVIFTKFNHGGGAFDK